MDHLAALAIFAALAAACWVVAVALCRSTLTGPDPSSAPHYRLVVATAVGAAALTGLIPFPAGYLAGLAVWSAAAFGFLRMTSRRAAALTAYLAAGSFVGRLAVLGAMDLFKF